MNKVILIGRLTAAPELRQTPNGVSVASFSIGVNRRFDREKSDFFNIIAWRGLGENCAKHLVKGQQVAIVGELQTRSYDDKNGVKRYITEVQADDIEFLAKPTGAGSQGGYSAPPPTQAPPQSNSQSESAIFASEIGEAMLEDEELPF